MKFVITLEFKKGISTLPSEDFDIGMSQGKFSRAPSGVGMEVTFRDAKGKEIPASTYLEDIGGEMCD